MPVPTIASRASAATAAPGVNCPVAPPTTYAAGIATQAAARPAAATRIASQRSSARNNGRMAAVSQALIDFANQVRSQPGPGVEVTATPRYHLTLQPDLPAAGPNSVAFIRCAQDEVDDMVREVHALVAPRRLPLMWTLDPGTKPPDLAARLSAHGVVPDPHGESFDVMVLPATAGPVGGDVAGLEILDALSSPEAFRDADAVSGEAFRSALARDTRGYPEQLERRRAAQRAAGNRFVLLATVDGEPAGTAGLTLRPPGGAILNGGAVRAKFRGRGVYRAMVAARLDIVRRAGLPGVSVWGGDMSGPILKKLGFVTVGWRKFYLDTSTA